MDLWVLPFSSWSRWDYFQMVKMAITLFMTTIKSMLSWMSESERGRSPLSLSLAQVCRAPHSKTTWRRPHVSFDFKIAGELAHSAYWWISSIGVHVRANERQAVYRVSVKRLFILEIWQLILIFNDYTSIYLQHISNALPPTHTHWNLNLNLDQQSSKREISTGCSHLLNFSDRKKKIKFH